jgi:hypothetical protein
MAKRLLQRGNARHGSDNSASGNALNEIGKA